MTGADWKSVTWEGNRRLQHEAFMTLSFREKMLEIERMAEVAALFESRRVELGLPRAEGGADDGAKKP